MQGLPGPVYSTIRSSRIPLGGFIPVWVLLTFAVGAVQFLVTPDVAWAAAPTVVSVVPDSGASAPDQWVILTATYSDSDGWKDLAEVRLLINRRFTSPAGAVYLRYNRLTNRLYLMNDRLTASLGGFAPGSAHIIENSQGRLDTAGTTVSGSGQTLTVTWRVSFKPAFSGGPYATSLLAQDRSRSTPLIAKGTWTVDSTAPSTPAVTDDGAYSGSATQLHAAWTSTDAESGIAEYQYAIGTTAGGTDVVDWTSAGTAAEVTKAGLTLTNGAKYYVSVKAQNGAGSWSAAGSSDGITVDSTAPSTPAVTDDGASTSSTSELHATWSSADPESGVAEYQYRITQDSRSGTAVADWTSAGKSAGITRTDLALTPGKTYYFAVKARNGVGLWSGVGYSDGILCPIATGPNFEITFPQEGAWIGGPGSS